MVKLTDTPQTETNHYQLREGITKGLLYFILTLGSVIAIVPFLWMIQTSFKTYGEYGQRVFWPTGLTLTPYTGRPRAKEMVISLEPTEEWQNAPRSFSPLQQATITVDETTDFLAERIMRDEGVSLPFDVLILALDTTDDGVQNYNEFVMTIDTPVMGQFTTRLTGDELGGPNIAGTRGRWGPHYRVLDPDPNHFVVQESWNVWKMLMHN
ncbi:MAG: hypothetical protein ACP5GX_01420, partial [Anaerolineae bacterium]